MIGHVAPDVGQARPQRVIATPEAFAGVRLTPRQSSLAASGVDGTVQNIIDMLNGHYAGPGAAMRRAIAVSHRWPVPPRLLDRVLRDAAGWSDVMPSGFVANGNLPTGHAT